MSTSFCVSTKKKGKNNLQTNTFPTYLCKIAWYFQLSEILVTIAAEVLIYNHGTVNYHFD